MSTKVIEVPSELKELIPGFLENRKKDLSELKTFIEMKKFDDISKIAHKIKGSAGGYGFDEMTQLASYMEQSAKSQNLAEIEKKFHEIETMLQVAEIKYID